MDRRSRFSDPGNDVLRHAVSYFRGDLPWPPRDRSGRLIGELFGARGCVSAHPYGFDGPWSTGILRRARAIYAEPLAEVLTDACNHSSASESFDQRLRSCNVPVMPLQYARAISPPCEKVLPSTQSRNASGMRRYMCFGNLLAMPRRSALISTHG